MSLTVCVAPAHTIAYPQGGGHLWVYLHWALAARALGCRVIWLEVLDPEEPLEVMRGNIAALRAHLDRFGLAESLALLAPDGLPLPASLAARVLDLEAAAEADLLLNLWHSLPAAVVRRFRRSALIDTDPGLLQVWMTLGTVRVAPHDLYFTIGETVGTVAARFPDCGLRWLYTPPPVFLPEWPVTPPAGPAPYTTVAHWWGGRFEFNGITYCDEKRVAFLEYVDLPTRTSVQLELAACLTEDREKARQRATRDRRLMEPQGWRLREAWEVTSTPEDYRIYIQHSRGEFSCAKPSTVALETAWVSDRTLCYLASGRPAIVQHTGASRILPDAEGLFRFRSLDEAARALAATEADYGRHCRLARALAEEHFDARRVVGRVLERALAPRTRSARMTEVIERRTALRRALEATGEPGAAELSDALEERLEASEPADQVDLRRLKARVYRLAVGKRGLGPSVVAKRLDPADAQRVRLAAERWLPALGLGDRCARLLDVVAERRGRSIWHVYEDMGDDTLAARPTPERVEAAVDLVAELHVRAARHAVLPEVRHYSSYRGMPYFIASVSDAVARLEALAASGIEPPPGHAGLPQRLYERLIGLLADAPRRARVFEDAGGPDTLLHGDLWTNNIFVTAGADRPLARLVDWDRLGVGPFGYDLSTFLFRFPAAQRPWILERYRHAVARAGWLLPPPQELYLLFDTAERARYANRVIWPVLALIREHADWGFPELAEVERWFRALDRGPAGGWSSHGMTSG